MVFAQLCPGVNRSGAGEGHMLEGEQMSPHTQLLLSPETATHTLVTSTQTANVPAGAKLRQAGARRSQGPRAGLEQQPAPLAPSPPSSSGPSSLVPLPPTAPRISLTHTHVLFPGQFTVEPVRCPSCSASAQKNSWVKDDGEVRNGNKGNPKALLAVRS